MPEINAHIERQKYLDGHILARTISLPDLFDVAVVNLKEDKGGMVIWPIPLAIFHPSKLAPDKDAVFIRDLISAMTSYFQYDLDEGIRKVITSLENCFSIYRLIPKSENFLARLFQPIFGKRFKIRKLINEYVKENYYPYIERDLAILRTNILFIYHLRNLVVHDRLRIHPSQTTVCRKAIGTLLYLYQGKFLKDEHRAYIFSFYSQFISIYEQYNGYSLELAEWNQAIEKKKTQYNWYTRRDE